MGEPLRLLHIEDSPSDAELVHRALGSLGRPIAGRRVEDRAGLLEALAAQSWDVVLSEWSLPRLGGLEALQILKQAKLDVPFIIVSGDVSEESAVAAMRAGARDYVLKDRLARLAPAIERELREVAEREALRISQARLTRLTESGIMGITINSPAGPVLEANDAFLAMVGYSREDLAAGALNWTRLTPPEWSTVNAQLGGGMDRFGHSVPLEKEYLRMDGTRVPVLVGVAALDATHTISISVDLSDRKEAEKKLRQTEEQLRHAQKMEAVGRLAAGVAHDFNNLLSVILSCTHQLLDDLPPDFPLREVLQEVNDAGKRGAEVTRQLLQFSRQRVFEPIDIDPRQALEALDKLLRRLVGEDVEFESRTAGSTGLVRVDPTGFEQVVMNLVVNARDAMPTGGNLTLELSDVVLDDDFARDHVGVVPGPHVKLSVTDTGVGMDPGTLSRVFEPFFTTKEPGKGTGLGLSTVFSIVLQSGGTVWVTSELGFGTTFHVYLPRVEEAPEGPGSVVAVAPPSGTETILLVEDADPVRTAAKRILARRGYRVIEAGHGAEALSLAARYPDPIHLLLTDVVMPKLSGPALAQRLTQVRPEMRVIFMSGYSDQGAVRHGLVEGSLAFMQKPFTPESLARKVREALDHPAPHGHLPA